MASVVTDRGDRRTVSLGCRPRVPRVPRGYLSWERCARPPFTPAEDLLPGILCAPLDLSGRALHSRAIECTALHDRTSDGSGVAYYISRAAERTWVEVPDTPGLRQAVLVGAAQGSHHLEVALCELRPGGRVRGHRHPFEESWFVFSGSGCVTLGGLSYDLGAGDYGFSPIGVAHSLEAGAEGLTWLCVRAPKPPLFDGARARLNVERVTGENLGRPSETDPRHRYVGHFSESDIAPFAELAMPGYHGPNIKNISIRMMVDRLLGAQHHTLFMATIAPKSGPGQAAKEHYHPFEEIYYFVSGGMRGVLDGHEELVGDGDLVWVSTDATHGFINERDVPARWLEVQSPVPPDSDAFFFPDDWRALSSVE